MLANKSNLSMRKYNTYEGIDIIVFDNDYMVTVRVDDLAIVNAMHVRNTYVYTIHICYTLKYIR